MTTRTLPFFRPRYYGPATTRAALTVVFGLVVILISAQRAQAQSLSFELEPKPAALLARLSSEQLGILEKLNRADRTRLARLARLVVPNRWDLDELDYSPLPRHHRPLESQDKVIVVDLPSQVFGTYQHGDLLRWGPISSGSKADPTPPGLFHLNWRSPGRASTLNPDWFMRWYFNFDSRAGRAFHAYELPGLPASHACLRMLERDARWLYVWGDEWTLGERAWIVETQGTPVVLLGSYDFEAAPPWRSPAWLEHGVQLPSAAMTQLAQ